MRGSISKDWGFFSSSSSSSDASLSDLRASSWISCIGIPSSDSAGAGSDAWLAPEPLSAWLFPEPSLSGSSSTSACEINLGTEADDSCSPDSISFEELELVLPLRKGNVFPSRFFLKIYAAASEHNASTPMPAPAATARKSG